MCKGLYACLTDPACLESTPGPSIIVLLSLMHSRHVLSLVGANELSMCFKTFEGYSQSARGSVMTFIA